MDRLVSNAGTSRSIQCGFWRQRSQLADTKQLAGLNLLKTISVFGNVAVCLVLGDVTHQTQQGEEGLLFIDVGRVGWSCTKGRKWRVGISSGPCREWERNLSTDSEAGTYQKLTLEFFFSKEDHSQVGALWNSSCPGVRVMSTGYTWALPHCKLENRNLKVKIWSECILFLKKISEERCSKFKYLALSSFFLGTLRFRQ